MSMQHTPGPWTATTGFVRAEHGAICTMSRSGPDSVLRWAAETASTTDAANARLIAAAPALLAALEELLAQVDHKRYNVRKDMGFFLADAQARAVLKLAKGE